MKKTIGAGIVVFLVSGCSSGGSSDVAVDAAREPLIGGRTALESELPSTVQLIHADGNALCTGTKIGSRLFLTASHCVVDQDTAVLLSEFSPGGTLRVSDQNQIRNGYGALRSAPVTIEQTSLPTPFNYSVAFFGPDSAIFRVSELTPEIPIAVLDAAPTVAGDHVVKTGYGCDGTFDPAHFKLQPTVTLSSSILSGVYTPAAVASLSGSYGITPRNQPGGVGYDPAGASGCPGDSGGPLYRDRPLELLVAGVNSGYDLRIGDYFSRVDAASQYHFADWARSVGARVRLPSAATPFGGSLPSTATELEAENFDLGGAGVAYVDTTPGNLGNSGFRSEDPDLYTSATAHSGKYVSADAGEWLQYTVSAVSAREYDLTLRVSGTAQVADALRVEIDGQDVSGPVSSVGISSAAWSTLTIPHVLLTPGTNPIRLRFAAALNLDSIGFVKYPFQCENGLADGTETDADCGGDRCGTCADQRQCLSDNDCTSSFCLAGQCSSTAHPVHVKAGYQFACGQFVDGKLRCWGRNDTGQLGVGPGDTLGDQPGELAARLQPLALPADVVSFALGGSHGCAIVTNNALYCWGLNSSGQLGVGDTTTRFTPVLVDLGGQPVELSLGEEFSCARMLDNSVRCWGANFFGQLGVGSTLNIGDGAGEMASSIAVALPTRALSISAGAQHACAVVAGPPGGSHEVRCWGYASSGQLGYGASAGLAYGDSPNETTPSPAMLGAFNPVKVAAGRGHTCAVGDTGDVKCWGDNGFGQLGYGDMLQRGRSPSAMGDNLLPVPLNEGTNRITVRESSTCVTNYFNEVKCWGLGGAVLGQPALASLSNIGDASNEIQALAPIDLEPNVTIVDFSSNGFSSCAVLNNGTVKCWGDNDYGQLGLGDTVRRGAAPNDMGSNLPRLVFP